MRAQTVFSGLVKLLVRELRTTERTNVIVLYLGGVSTLGAAAACLVLPGGFVLPTRAPQIYYLLGAGPSSFAGKLIVNCPFGAEVWHRYRLTTLDITSACARQAFICRRSWLVPLS